MIGGKVVAVIILIVSSILLALSCTYCVIHCCFVSLKLSRVVVILWVIADGG